DPGVLDRVVQEGRRQGRLVQLQAREDLRRPPGVVDELLPRPPKLPVVGARGEVEGPGQQLPVDIGLVALHLTDELIDEILVSFEYCHVQMILLPFSSTSAAGNRVARVNALCSCSSGAD